MLACISRGNVTLVLSNKIANTYFSLIQCIFTCIVSNYVRQLYIYYISCWKSLFYKIIVHIFRKFLLLMIILSLSLSYMIVLILLKRMFQLRPPKLNWSIMDTCRTLFHCWTLLPQIAQKRLPLYHILHVYTIWRHLPMCYLQ